MGQFEPGVVKLLEGKNFAAFVTLLGNGSPHVAPIWIDHDEDTILVNTAMGRLKEKNVRKDPRVALSIYDNENPYHMVAIRGKVTEITTNDAEEHVDKLAKRYLGMDKYPRRSPDEKRILIKIHAEKIHHQDYS